MSQVLDHLLILTHLIIRTQLQVEYYYPNFSIYTDLLILCSYSSVNLFFFFYKLFEGFYSKVIKWWCVSFFKSEKGKIFINQSRAREK